MKRGTEIGIKAAESFMIIRDYWLERENDDA